MFHPVTSSGNTNPFTKIKNPQKGDAMNPEQLLNDVAEAIKKRPASTATRYWLIGIRGKFSCIPVAPGPPDCVILGTFNDNDLTKGLTCRQWAQVMSELAKCEPKETV